MSEKLIPTAHIELEDSSMIAKTVIMPGDPLRAKFIADTFLTDVTQINSVRGMLGYTGNYNSKKISVMGSGMGMPSIGIYSYELFSFYDVDNIIRVGSAGAYTKDLDLYDIVIVSDAYSESTFGEVVLGEKCSNLKSDVSLNKALINSANELNIKYNFDTIHSSDVFYRKNYEDYIKINKEYGCTCVEMESFALFANAKVTGKKAACILTISDNLVTHAATTSEERQKAFLNMMKIALNAKI